MSNPFIKVILPDSYNFNDPIASLVPIHKNGIDKSWMIKRAASDIFEKFATFKPQPDHSLIHLIAMGAADSFGFNRNGDGFYKYAQKLDLPGADWKTQTLPNGQTIEKSSETFKDSTDVGLKDTYETFTKFGKVFKHHKNRPHKGDTVYGDIKCAAYNDPMDRVELLIEVDNKRWENDLQKIANDEQIPFSMSCFVNPNIPVLTATGYKSLVDLTSSDMVLTHKGNWKHVKKVITRKYTGKIANVIFNGNPVSIDVTVDHPVLSSMSPAHVKQLKTLVKEAPPKAVNELGAEWNHIGHLSAGDQIICLAPRAYPGYEEICNRNFARFLGEVYCGTEFDIPPQMSAYLSPYLMNTNAERRGIYLGLFNSPEEVRLAFLGALIDGDGFGLSEITAVLEDTSWENTMCLKDLFASCSIPCQMQAVAEPNKRSLITYQLLFNIGSLYPLIGHAAELTDDPDVLKLVKQNYNNQDTSMYNFYQSVDIRTISFSDAVDVPVYNLEVEDDHSYVVSGLVVHNCLVPYDICSHCGKKSKDRSEYCNHLTEGITSLTKSGHIVGAINDHMRFFDISRVNRPADRIAWSLAKAAGLTRAADLAFDEDYSVMPAPEVLFDEFADRYTTIDKLAQIEKQIPMAGQKLKTISKAFNPNIRDDATLNTLAGKHEKCSALLTTLTTKGIALPFESFSRLILGNNYTKLASVVDYSKTKLNTLFNDRLTNKGVISNYAYDPITYLIDSNYVKTAETLEPEFGLSNSAIERRILRYQLSSADLSVSSVKSASNPSDKVIQASNDLMDQYASYLISFVNSHPLNEKFAELVVLQNFVGS